MDDGGEGISWIGDIVQKFEDLFSEVDVVVRQEFTSVTNQLHTVGANVVKFCCDLVENESPQSSHNKVKDQASDVDHVDSDASQISVDEYHCQKESSNENYMLCSSSVEPTDSFQFVASGEQNVDSRVYEKSEVIGKENLVKERQFNQISVVVSPKGEESNNLEEDKQLQHETSLRVSLKGNRQLQYETSKADSNNLENTSIYILSPILSSYSVNSNADASTGSSEDILDIDVEDADTMQSFDKVKFDESDVEEDDLEFKERLEKFHAKLSWTKQALHQVRQDPSNALHQFRQDREFLHIEDHESYDSDWVIV